MYKTIDLILELVYNIYKDKGSQKTSQKQNKKTNFRRSILWKSKQRKKAIKENYSNVLAIGYAEYQDLLDKYKADYYTSGVYGWNANIFTIDKLDTAIVTGYRHFGEWLNDEQLAIFEKYDNKAKKLSEFWDSVTDSTEYFKDLTGYEMYFNGRSSGYIVTDIDIIDYEDLKTMSKKELQKVTEILQKFDDFCDALRSDLIYYLDNATIEEIEETIINTRKVLTI